jgi:hypothetical protein
MTIEIKENSVKPEEVYHLGSNGMYLGDSLAVCGYYLLHCGSLHGVYFDREG